jgi:hypothetical protein
MSSLGIPPARVVPRAGDRLRHEARLTWRMLVDNASACLAPALLFTLAAALHARLPAGGTLLRLLGSGALFVLFAYVFDASNQARGAEEDRLNKPRRPVPAGLATPGGLIRRFWLAMPLYTALGWCLGVLWWTVLWQVVVVYLNLLAVPRCYLWYKTPAMLVGTTAQLAAAWQIAAPLDATAVRWLVTLAALYVPALVFEDVRDMDGDRAAGRRTPALVLGAWAVRVWFAALMAVTPPLLHLLLFAPAGTAGWRTAVCDLAVAATCWTCAVRALLLRRTPADRATYQLFGAAFATALATGAVLWW